MEKDVIGRRISGLLADRGLTQKELAVAVGVHVNVVSYWCRSVRVPNIDQIVDIAKFFGVPTDYLLGVSDVETLDMDMMALCHTTGLTKEAAANLLRFSRPQEPETEDVMPAVNAMLSDSAVSSGLVSYIYFLMEDCERADDYLREGEHPDSRLAKAMATGKLVDGMELSLFRADEAFRSALDKALGYRRIIDGLRNI